jgi:signal transduction histidine kinase
MKKRPPEQGPISISLRRNPQGNKSEITSTVRWVALSTLFLFLALLIVFLLNGNFAIAQTIAVGIIPILISIALLGRDAVSVPSTILAVTIILLITRLATLGQGIYDIGVLGYPVILIVAGLVLRDRVITYLSAFIILCVGWLIFGDIWGWYTPGYAAQSFPQDFFIAGIIILIAGNSVLRLARNVYDSLSRAEYEIEIRKKVEQEREELIRQLKLKNQELDRFAVRVSHDLKTPLITVAGFLGYLEKDIKAGKLEQVDRNMAQINDAARKMGKFVDELLDLSRVGRIVNPAADVAFADLVQDALTAADGPLMARQVQVEVAPDLPIVHVDRVRIVQVLQNLITNAIKFMGTQPHPILRIGFDELAGEYTFSVADNGIGIAAAHHKSIFELFSKLDPNTEGAGIGLGLVKRIIEVHGGRIWVESDGDGKGSTFRFTLRKQAGNFTNRSA